MHGAAQPAHPGHPGSPEDPSSRAAGLNHEGLLLALDHTDTGIWQWDTVSHQNVWSEAVWRLYGLDPTLHPACFDSWLTSVHPEDQQTVSQTVRQAAHRRAPFEVQWRTHPDRGPVRWLMSRGYPASHPADPLYTGVVLDITARREAELTLQTLNATLEQRVAERTAALSDHQHRLQHILDGIPGMVGYWDRDYRNRFANRAYQAWFGKSPEALCGTHIRELLGEDLFAKNLPYMEAALRGEPQCFERDIRTPSGELRYGQAHYVPDWRDGVVQGFLVLVFDISAVRAARQAAEEANQAKSTFLANISHELRTPLNAVFGLAQLGCRQSRPDETRHTFGQILATGRHLLALINDVLDYSRIEAGTLTIQEGEVDLAMLLDHVLTMCAPQAETKGLSLLVSDADDVPRRFRGDFTRCAQILLNLVTNAIKFTDHGMVHLDLDVTQDTLHITVRDTGIGIPPEARHRLFKPFEQLHVDEARRADGTGLGLAISQRLAGMMGGSITLASELGQGSTFTLSLPLHETAAVDWHPLRQVAALRSERIAMQRLTHLLQAREPRMQMLNTLPSPARAPRILLMHQQEVGSLPTPALLALTRSGCRLILVGPPHGSARAEEVPVITVSEPQSPLRLLYAVEQAGPSGSVGDDARRLAGLRILAAEDNPVNRVVLEQMLQQEGAEVDFACDGLQALDRVRARGDGHFDLVLCDIQMPHMDGYETTQALAHLAPGLPVIGLTAHAFQAARERAFQAGMVDYVTKPYLLTPLVEAILRHSRRPPKAPDADGPAPNAAAPDRGPPGPSTLPGDVNAEAFWTHYAHQPALRTRLVTALEHTLPELARQLQDALSAQDLEAAGRVLHNVKGTALNLHAPMLTAQAITGLTHARAGSALTWESVQEVATSLQSLMTGLHRLGDDASAADAVHRAQRQ